jgi:methylmalonyl-CoA carboxyltransferase large subunit
MDDFEKNRLAETLEALRREVEALHKRIAAVEQALAAAPSPSAATASSPAAKADPAGPTAELIAIISAALAAHLGVHPHIRQIKLLGGASWAQQGRVTIQASHALAFPRD